jgi:hypothetical protein
VGGSVDVFHDCELFFLVPYAVKGEGMHTPVVGQKAPLRRPVVLKHYFENKNTTR